MRAILPLGLGLCNVFVAVAAAPVETAPADIRAALGKAIPLIEKSTEEYPKHRTCFSCHHQAVPALALALAPQRGLSVGETALHDIGEHTRADLESALDDYRKGKGQPGGAERAGYALFTLDTAGHKRDDVTNAVVDYLLAAHKDRDHWP